MLTKRPKSIKDCYKLDKTSEQLIEWSHNLSDWADLIFYGLIGLGIMLFIAAAVVFWWIDHEIISISSLSGGICCVIAAFIARAVLRSKALLICAKAHIVHNTRVTANLALYNACKNSDPSEYNEDTDIKSTNKKDQPKKDNKTAYNENAIIESEENVEDDEDDEEYASELPQKTCPQCGNKHDFDYPKCPKCKYEYYK